MSEFRIPYFRTYLKRKIGTFIRLPPLSVRLSLPICSDSTGSINSKFGTHLWRVTEIKWILYDRGSWGANLLIFCNIINGLCASRTGRPKTWDCYKNKYNTCPTRTLPFSWFLKYIIIYRIVYYKSKILMHLKII